MGFRDDVATQQRPPSIRRNVLLPRRQECHPSPSKWRDEVLYFLLVDRFSDGREAGRRLLDRTALARARPSLPSGEPWRWDRWAQSGADRYQGGTLQGVESKLAYLKGLGVTALWLSPVLKQRRHLDTYHGYGAMDFLDVDPRFGTRQDLVNLVAAAHAREIRVILDIIFNHTGHNWNYPDNQAEPTYRPWPGHYEFGAWLGADGEPIAAVTGVDQGVWPTELQEPGRYTRAGKGSLGAGDLNDPHAEHKRTDFLTLRDVRTDDPETLSQLAQVYKYWIALTDCDGFRIDTLKHVALEEARSFCGALKEYAVSLGKHDFFLVGEVAGGSFAQDFYLDGLPRNVNAVLDIGEARPTLEAVAKGLTHPEAYFSGFSEFDPGMGSHRNLGDHHVSILNDHDHVSGVKLRFTPDVVFDHQVVAGVAIQLFTLGIPCVYYGTEQALSPPESGEQGFLPEFGSSDRYLREAMFGPRHPKRSGTDGIPPTAVDENLPGFGPFGTAGHHCFDEAHPAYVRIAALNSVRRDHTVLRAGRQYPRPHDVGGQVVVPGPGELICWSRILDAEEALVVVNSHGKEARRGRILVDAALNPAGGTMSVIANTAKSADAAGFTGPHGVGSTVSVEKEADGRTFVTVDSVGPSEVVILANLPDPEVGRIISS